jgi:ribosomal protein L16 Arg81 hydroxylase
LPTFGIGGLNSGVSFHTHGAAFGETIIGKKKWFLSPPTRRPIFNSSISQLDWSLSMADKNQDVISCIVGEGEVIYIPPNWWHATLNLANWNSFVSTFTREKMTLLT